MVHVTDVDGTAHRTDITDEFRESGVWDLVVATSGLERGRRALDARSRLGHADLRLMWLLVAEGPRTMKEISHALHLEQSTVNRQVNAALRAGLVERVARPDEPARVVRATDAGQELFAGDLRRVVEVLEAALDAVPDAARESFTAQLRAFAGAYRAAAEAPGD